MNSKYIRSIKLINKRHYNLGVDILRVILSFSVVMDHLYNPKILKKYVYILYYHIPTFFLISFFFTFNTLTSFNITKIKLRFHRLIIPYISWSIIGYIVKFIYYLLKINKFYSLNDFIQHMICGHILNIPLWYLANLILITIFFLIIILVFKNHNLIIFHIIMIICYILQYSGLNYYFIRKYLRHHAMLSFGRFIESIPNSITGYTFANIKIIEKLLPYRQKTIFFSFSILIIITKYNVFDNLKTFKYGGIRLNLAASCIFIIFALLPFDLLKSKFTLSFIKQVTSYTGGIFYMHFLVGTCFLIKKILNSLNYTILGCMIVYLICYYICYFGIKIFGKSNLKYLFI